MFAGKGTENLQYSHVVVPHAVTPFITIYRVSGTSTVKISNPSILPSGFPSAADFPQDGRYLGLSVISAAPYVMFYERQGDTYTKLNNPATMPSVFCAGGAWDPTGTYYCAPDENTGARKFDVYKRSSNTLTLITGITKPTGTVQLRACAWDRTGTLVAITSYQTPFLVVYFVNRDTDTFTRITTPCDVFPTGLGIGISFNQADSLAVAHQNSPFLSIYNVTYAGTATSFTKVANPASLPNGAGQSCDWNTDGTSLAISTANTPFINVYNRNGNVFTKITPALPALTGGGGFGCRFSSDGTLLFCGPYNAPHFEYYQRSGDTFTKLPGPAIRPTGVTIGQLAIFSERG
jgi:hypothetical protein